MRIRGNTVNLGKLCYKAMKKGFCLFFGKDFRKVVNNEVFILALADSIKEQISSALCRK